MTLADVLADPMQAATLSPADRARLIAEALALVAVLVVPPVTVPAPGADLELLTAEDVGALFHVPESKVAELMRRGEIPVVMIGRYPRIRRSDLAAVLDRLTIGKVASVRDRRRVTTAPRATPPHPGRNGRLDGLHDSSRIEVGVRRPENVRAGEPVPPAAGSDAE